ncbi:hypothetical protein JW824_11640 [bacterium]|nr:hypothetical protein [bacterium]
MLNRLLKVRIRLGNEKGLSLIDVIAMLIILGIAVPALTRLSVVNSRGGAKFLLMTRAVYSAEGIMEQIMADYRSPNRGYDWVKSYWAGTAPALEAGFSCLVSISSESTFNGLSYVDVTVTVSNPDFPDVVLNTSLFQ